MPLRSLFTATRSLVFLGGLTALSACHDHETGVGREPDEYVGCATDELWPAFDDVADVASPADAPVLTAPTGTTLSATPVDFSWRPSAASMGSPGGDVPSSCEGYNTGYTTLHLAPISGTVYDLQVSVGGTVQRRVLTTLQKWTASPAVWSSFSGKTIEVRVRRLNVLNNDRKDGPFSSVTTSFSVQ